MTHSHVTWLIHMWHHLHMTHSYVTWRDSFVGDSTEFICDFIIHMRRESYHNESYHFWMSHVTSEWVMSHLNESCHIWMSHVTHVNDEVMSHMFWMSHVTHVHMWLHNSYASSPSEITYWHVTLPMWHDSLGDSTEFICDFIILMRRHQVK